MNNRPNSGGRIKGTPNKITKDIRESFQNLIENNMELIENDLQLLEPIDRLEIVIKLTEFVIPKLTRTSVNKFELIAGIDAEFVD